LVKKREFKYKKEASLIQPIWMIEIFKIEGFHYPKCYLFGRKQSDINSIKNQIFEQKSGRVFIVNKGYD